MFIELNKQNFNINLMCSFVSTGPCTLYVNMKRYSITFVVIQILTLLKERKIFPDSLSLVPDPDPDPYSVIRQSTFLLSYKSFKRC